MFEVPEPACSELLAFYYLRDETRFGAASKQVSSSFYYLRDTVRYSFVTGVPRFLWLGWYVKVRCSSRSRCTQPLPICDSKQDSAPLWTTCPCAFIICESKQGSSAASKRVSGPFTGESYEVSVAWPPLREDAEDFRVDQGKRTSNFLFFFEVLEEISAMM